jgi:hypothetical protein
MRSKEKSFFHSCSYSRGCAFAKDMKALASKKSYGVETRSPQYSVVLPSQDWAPQTEALSPIKSTEATGYYSFRPTKHFKINSSLLYDLKSAAKKGIPAKMKQSCRKMGLICRPCSVICPTRGSLWFVGDELNY